MHFFPHIWTAVHFLTLTDQCKIGIESNPTVQLIDYAERQVNYTICVDINEMHDALSKCKFGKRIRSVH